MTIIDAFLIFFGLYVLILGFDKLMMFWIGMK